MVKIAFEVKVLMTIMFFFAFLGILNLLVPPDLQIVNTFDFVWFGGGIIGVSSACAIATGLPCAVALAIFGVVSLLGYILVANSLIKLLIFLPLTVTIIYLVSRLAKGGG